MTKPYMDMKKAIPITIHVEMVKTLKSILFVLAVNRKAIFCATGPTRYKSRIMATINPKIKSVIPPKKEICPNVSLR